MRPRATLGAALTLGAFLLFAPAAFVLLPLTLLLLASRPVRSATWLWVVAGAFWSFIWLAATGVLVEQVLKGWIVVTSGVFLLLVLRGRRRAIDAALTAALVASLVTLAWLRVFHVGLEHVVTDVLRVLWAQYRALGDAAPGLRAQFTDASVTAGKLAVVFPAFAILLGIAGMLLAWRWARWLADPPPTEPPAPFREFRFSDHFVWLFALGLAGTVAQAMDLLPPAGWPVNLLVVFGALYALRGLAVARWVLARWDLLPNLTLLLAAALFVLFLLPSALAAFLGIGLADTWLDFRRPPEGAPGE